MLNIRARLKRRRWAGEQKSIEASFFGQPPWRRIVKANNVWLKKPEKHHAGR